ncbi:MAG: sulfate ABC transporter permease subunit CysT [Tepidisphaerales bacterium]
MPGFGLSLGVTATWVGLLVVLPLAALVARSVGAGWAVFAEVLTSERALAALGLSFGAATVAATANVLLGTLVAWVLVRYEFPGRGVLDALVDLPFAMPTAVSGLALTAVYASDGWLGRWLSAAGVEVAYTRLGVVVALMFIGLPFVVRSVQPALSEVERELEEAAMSLGASRFQTLWRVVRPVVMPAMLTGFGMALARGLGEYGSVVFIAGNVPGETEIAPLLIMMRLESFDDAGAVVLAVVMLAASVVLMAGVHVLQARSEAWLSGGNGGVR